MSHPNPFPYTVLSHCYPVRHSCHRVPHQAVLPGDGTVAPLCCQAPTVPINIYMYWKGWRRDWVCCAATAQICDSPCSPVCLCPSCFSSFPLQCNSRHPGLWLSGLPTGTAYILLYVGLLPLHRPLCSRARARPSLPCLPLGSVAWNSLCCALLTLPDMLRLLSGLSGLSGFSGLVVPGRRRRRHPHPPPATPPPATCHLPPTNRHGRHCHLR